MARNDILFILAIALAVVEGRALFHKHARFDRGPSPTLVGEMRRDVNVLLRSVGALVYWREEAPKVARRSSRPRAVPGDRGHRPAPKPLVSAAVFRCFRTDGEWPCGPVAGYLSPWMDDTHLLRRYSFSAGPLVHVLADQVFRFERRDEPDVI
jgi:hypothetical protein